MDLVIPREKFDESMIILHKMSGLPLSNFVYIEKVHTKSNFRLSDQNLKKVIEYHKRDIWFSEKAREKFEKLIRNFRPNTARLKTVRQKLNNCVNKIEKWKLVVVMKLKRMTNFI